ncbi:protein rapunzel-like [Gasterosteus aculeatus]
MDGVADWLVLNRDNIEKGVEIMGEASEVLAATVGKLHPVLEAVFKTSAMILKNPDSKEARYLTEQFELVNQKLVGIQGEINQIMEELQIGSINKQNFEYEMHMRSQYDKLQDFLNAKPEYKEIKMGMFIRHYENTGADRNLDALYNAVVGNGPMRYPLLEILVSVKKRSRRTVEDFCAGLKKLFVVGIIAVMGHSALKEGVVGEEMVKKWQGRMEDVENRMKAAVDDCTDNFAVQAKLDMEHLVKEKSGAIKLDLAKSLLESLVKKYDWVKWSIRAFAVKERFFFFNWLAGKKCHGSGGANWFEILTNSKVIVVVSFCVDPKPINKSEIQEKIEGQKMKGNMVDVAQALSSSFPDCLVHAVSHYKEVVESNNFHEDSYYYGKRKGTYLCIHPE